MANVRISHYNSFTDPLSRGGVNDGEGLVAGSQNIKSFAPIEDAPFAEDDRPSLYDVFSDTFEEPPIHGVATTPLSKKALGKETQKSFGRQQTQVASGPTFDSSC